MFVNITSSEVCDCERCPCCGKLRRKSNFLGYPYIVTVTGIGTNVTTKYCGTTPTA